jgi:hypothetical protein
MSSFIGTPSGVGVGQWLTRDDIRLWNRYDGHAGVFYHILPTEPFHHQGYTTGWWPGTGGLDASGNEWLNPTWRSLPEMNSGAVSKMAFIGISQDQYGSAIAACTMKLFKTENGNYIGTKDTKLDEVVSDSLGNFILYTPYYPDTHYITLLKNGAPSIQGISVNTLIGA